MHPDAAKELGEFLDKLEAAGAPDACYPRLFFFGHEIVYGIAAPKGAWKSPITGEEFEYCSRACRWRCRSCKHEWEGEDGNVCPSCKAESNR